ncbi:MAG: hypothetical protein J0L84_20935, partial [Verrucomicrobia bacterium]|nr:hypothetical protein [Verrucomicrobiota bacterium]
MQLRAGGSIVAEDNNSQVVGNGQFIESTVEVDVPANHPQINQFLEIWLGAAFPAGQSRFTYFDKVSLDGPPSECERFADSITDFSTT